MTPETLEHKKLCLYRYWWPLRNNKLTRSHKTHSERFREIYGQTLEEYHQELAERNQQARHEATKRFYREVGL